MEQHVLFAYNVNIFINNEGKHWKSSLTLGGKALLFMGESETGPDVWRTYQKVLHRGRQHRRLNEMNWQPSQYERDLI